MSEDSNRIPEIRLRNTDALFREEISTLASLNKKTQNGELEKLQTRGL